MHDNDATGAEGASAQASTEAPSPPADPAKAFMENVVRRMLKEHPGGREEDVIHAVNDLTVHRRVAHLVRQRAAYGENVFPLCVYSSRDFQGALYNAVIDDVADEVARYDFGYKPPEKDVEVRLALRAVPLNLYEASIADFYLWHVAQGRPAGMRELLRFAEEYPLIQERVSIIAAGAPAFDEQRVPMLPYLNGVAVGRRRRRMNVARCPNGERVRLWIGAPHVLVIVE